MSLTTAALVVAFGVTLPSRASAQACCVGASAVTPARLAPHEDALVALSARAAHVFGTWDSTSSFSTLGRGATEQDFESDVIGALRVPGVDRLQVALVVPWILTRRAARGSAELGGGLGDVALSARFDIVFAGRRRFVPGVALLAGATFPTGRPVDQASSPQATDATGTGALQGSVGVAVEQVFGPWLVSAYGLVAKRAPREAQGISTTLGSQWSALLALAYTFPNDVAAALSASYASEGDAEVQGAVVPNSARQTPALAVTFVAPIAEHVRLQGGVSVSPPIESLAQNQPASAALQFTGLYAWF